MCDKSLKKIILTMNEKLKIENDNLHKYCRYLVRCLHLEDLRYPIAY